jgi:hypothetical protein
MRSIVLGLLVAVAATAGCATGGNTPAQTLAWERWKECDHFSTITLERIDLDGRLVVTGYESTAGPFTACVQEAEAAQGRKGGSAGLTAGVLVRRYGCQGGAM